MNGLQALMPQGQQKERADAAMGIASSSLEGANLPPEMEHATEVKRAKNILAAADAQLAIKKGQPQQPPQVVPRMRQELNQRLQPQTMQGGLVDMLRSLQGGMQQRGRQSAMAGRMPPAQGMPQMQRQMPQRPAPQQMQRPAPQMQGQRPPMGGIAGLPAPNMARPQMAAQGGVIGYRQGGDIATAQAYIDAEKTLNNPNATDEDKMFASQLLSQNRPESQGGSLSMEQYSALMMEVNRLMGLGTPSIDDPAPTAQKPGAGMGKNEDGKPKGFAGPDGSVVSSLPANATAEQVDAFYAGQPIPPRPSEGATELEQAILDAAVAEFQRDATAEGRAAGERVEELTALTEERAQLQQAQDALREAMGARLTPEQERRRMRRAAFRGMKEGLGGASRRIGEEEAAIQAERVGIAKTSVDDYQKVVDSLEARGMSRAEAERTVQVQTQRDVSAGISTAASLANQLRQSETTRRGQDRQYEVGMAQVGKPTDFVREIEIRVNALQQANPQMDLTTARRKALEEKVEASTRAALAASGISADRLDVQKLESAYAMAASKLANRMDLTMDPAAYNQAFDAEVQRIVQQLGGGTSTTGPSAAQLQQLRDANPGVSDEKLIEFFNTLDI